MNVSISYKHVESQQAVAAEVVRRLDKLGRLLKSYEPRSNSGSGDIFEKPEDG